MSHAAELEPHQQKWIEQNCNANRTNALDLNDSTTRYLNSPLRFTLGGEAGYALKNLTDGVNVWDRDLEYFDQQLQGADGLLFLTVAKVAFISGIRVESTGLVFRAIICGTAGSRRSSRFSGEASFAFGPLGRTATGEAMVATDASTATATAYSQSRGFYGGVTVDARTSASATTRRSPPGGGGFDDDRPAEARGRRRRGRGRRRV
ncbi:hypothetical protein SO694_00120079 [Aureococcus anophagefferens]|uniref:Ysc84 actin-binding domain-containing protein n=1 Tax=Aureococcus anophagefferens TaxID=44056 RepID=A0ABR1G3F1_AURAN